VEYQRFAPPRDRGRPRPKPPARHGFVDAGYVVDRAFDGEEGHFLGESEPYDAVILDIGLPKMDGISVLEAWRRAGKIMPVLMLTARDRWSDKVQGFDAGADDYVAKPSISRKSWPACARCCAARLATQERI